MSSEEPEIRIVDHHDGDEFTRLARNSLGRAISYMQGRYEATRLTSIVAIMDSALMVLAAAAPAEAAAYVQTKVDAVRKQAEGGATLQDAADSAAAQAAAFLALVEAVRAGGRT